MKPPNYEYVRADSLNSALEALAGSSADGDIKVLAGGQSLVPLMNFRLARPRALLDINMIGGQAYHRLLDGRVELGALCRHRDIEFDSAVRGCDAIREAVPLIGHVAIRNRGTVLGSLVHGDPLAEWSTLAVLLKAQIQVRSISGSRAICAGDWFQGFFETDIRADELATSLTFDLPESAAGTGTAFAEISRRHGDFCLVSAAAMVRLNELGSVGEVRLAVGGLKAVPWDAGEHLSECSGAKPDDALWEGLVRALPDVASGITSDIHASGATRRQMAKTLVRRTLATASARANAAYLRSVANGN